MKRARDQQSCAEQAGKRRTAHPFSREISLEQQSVKETSKLEAKFLQRTLRFRNEEPDKDEHGKAEAGEDNVCSVTGVSLKFAKSPQPQPQLGGPEQNSISK